MSESSSDLLFDGLVAPFEMRNMIRFMHALFESPCIRFSTKKSGRATGSQRNRLGSSSHVTRRRPLSCGEAEAPQAARFSKLKF